MLWTQKNAKRHAEMWRRGCALAPRVHVRPPRQQHRLRSMATQADVSAQESSWAQRNRHNIIHVGLSGSLFFISMQLVNKRNQAEDMETELREQLRITALARETILKRAPELAREAGLPASSLTKFELSLRSLAAQPDGDLANFSEAASTTSASVAEKDTKIEPAGM